MSIGAVGRSGWWRCEWKSIAAVAAAGAVLTGGVSAEGEIAAAVGAERDEAGRLYVLYSNGNLRHSRGTVRGTVLQSLPFGAVVRDLTVDHNGNLAIVTSGTASEPGGGVGIYDWKGRRLHEIALPRRWSSHGIASVDDRLEVLGVGSDGAGVLQIDAAYSLVPEARSLQLDCDGIIGELVMAAGDAGEIWVARKESCRSQYTVRKYDRTGKVKVEVARSATSVARTSDEGKMRTVTPAVLDVFVAGAHLGVVLNWGSHGLCRVDIWTTRGEFVHTAEVPTPLPLRAVGRADGTVDFLHLGGVVTMNIQALLRREPMR